MSDDLRDDRRAAMVIESGVIFGAIDRTLERTWRGAGDSAAVAAASRLAGTWRELGTSAQRFAVGVMLVVAAVVHLAFTIATAMPSGWLWLIVPALCLGTGAIVLASSSTRNGQGLT